MCRGWALMFRRLTGFPNRAMLAPPHPAARTGTNTRSWPPSNGLALFRGAARTSDRRWDMEDAGLSRRHMLRAAGALGALTAVAGPTVVFAQPATRRHR